MRRLFWTTADLTREGRSTRDIAALVDAGRLLPVRRGLWTAPGTPTALVRAARTGGAATATTGAEAIGLWTPPDGRLHVAVPSGATRLRDPDDAGLPLRGDDLVKVTYSNRMPSPRSLPDRIAPVPLVLEHAVRALRPELAIAILDSALHQRRIRASDLATLSLALPQHLRGLLRHVDGRADSGLESIVRYLLTRAGFAVTVHPVIPGVGEVDMLIAGVLILETDGKRYHVDQQFQIDRDRDRAAALAGYRVLRLTYRQILWEWPTTFAAICAALAQAA